MERVEVKDKNLVPVLEIPIRRAIHSDDPGFSRIFCKSTPLSARATEERRAPRAGVLKELRLLGNATEDSVLCLLHPFLMSSAASS